MSDYTTEEIAALLRRSYQAVDGLWFVIAEQHQGFAEALAMDEEVWQVMPKIQARKAREILALTGGGLEALARCLGLKMAAEGNETEVHSEAGHLEIRLNRCTWHDVFEKAQRLHLAQDIARHVCANEAAGWAQEFGVQACFDPDNSICGGASCCRFVFSEENKPSR